MEQSKQDKNLMNHFKISENITLNRTLGFVKLALFSAYLRSEICLEGTIFGGEFRFGRLVIQLTTNAGGGLISHHYSLFEIHNREKRLYTA